MGFSKSIYIAAIDQKRKIQQKNDLLREYKKQQLYNDFPRAKEIDRELSSLGMEITLCAFSGDTQKLAELKDRCTSLNAERAKLAPEDYGIPYECSLCKDTGTYNGRPCDCIEAAAKKLQFSTLSSAAPLDECRLDNFNLDYYSDVSEGKASPRVRMEKIFAYIQKYINNFPKGENLLLVGNTGLGKTHISIAIANAVIEKGYGVFYSSAEYLISKIQKEKFGKSDVDFSYYEAALDCDLLVLDDLGTEFSTQFSKSVIYDIINTRILTKKSTIINTNLFMPEIKETYSPRIASRLIGEYTSLLFEGADIRQLKKNEKK